MTKNATPISLKAKYLKELAPILQKELKLKNSMACPKISKITINVGIGSYIQSHNKDFSNIIENITAICGQKPVIAKAKKSISNFKIRKGDPIGVIATLRGKRMYDFLNKLINIVLPRVRDFRGLSKKAFDGKGNYTIGLKEHVVFPETSQDDLSKIHGIQINIITTAKNNEEGYELLKAFRFPFKNN